jgi:hypothetical protein
MEGVLLVGVYHRAVKQLFVVASSLHLDATFSAIGKNSRRNGGMENPHETGPTAIPSVRKPSEKLFHEYRPAPPLMQTVFRREDSAVWSGFGDLSIGLRHFATFRWFKNATS